MVLEAAVNGRADWLVTFNVRDFGEALKRFGLEVLSPWRDNQASAILSSCSGSIA
jgi:hypothetical protein